MRAELYLERDCGGELMEGGKSQASTCFQVPTFEQHKENSRGICERPQNSKRRNVWWLLIQHASFCL
ncbi:hypothetical protein BDP55DRAFT_642763 [Colletotrichum godetiae]|uniref:Uncharacterized protein n=1 Tax=Colletotrichum godetiae TaxID=1209918 RepID=A0AAJ0AY05_9PEZI|nr:uncharacterized protein BDP55DRAFT_642763 [Colletotrichum godetiae]KAK1700386.1 hypothetical protein BDP55DRAFT_642763 [Colletotrichum godetiae]